MLPSNVIKFVKKRKDAEKIVQVFDGYTKKVKYPSIEVHQNMLLCLAVEHNHLQLVKLLARRGADVNFHVSKNETICKPVLRTEIVDCIVIRIDDQ